MPVAASEQVLGLVQELVQKAYPPSDPNELAKGSPIYLEWDAATSFVECWTNGLKQVDGQLQVKMKPPCYFSYS